MVPAHFDNVTTNLSWTLRDSGATGNVHTCSRRSRSSARKFLNVLISGMITRNQQPIKADVKIFEDT
jgi:hypothetical protein